MPTIAKQKAAKRLRPKSASSPVEGARGIPAVTRLLLCTKAGGRCEFDGCNRYVLEHPVTHKEGMFAEAAHIVAFKPDGPRGLSGKRPADIHAVENLMLLCPQCHHLIDQNPGIYPRELLEKQKIEHEARIRHLTALGPDRQTAIVVMKAPIGGQEIVVPAADIATAVLPRYPASHTKVEIDLSRLAGTPESPEFLKVACESIDRKIASLLEAGSDADRVAHASIFAIGPIPLLIHLGHKLTSKVPMDFYQRHRDTENWTWKTSGEPARYAARCVRPGHRGKAVALLVSLSGPIRTEDLPGSLSDAAVYELTLESAQPNPTFLRQRADLEAFRVAFQEVIGLILADHGLVDWIELFPAIPSPIAVLCGRERLPKVHPGLRVYDLDKRVGSYQLKLEIK